MTEFTLKPFVPAAAKDLSKGLSIGGTVVRASHQLAITYELTGDLQQVQMPDIKGNGARCDRLWEQTCFEFFLAAGWARSPQLPYWEFNLSPAGDWNVFSLSSCRQGLQAEAAIATLPFTVYTSPDKLQLSISVELTHLIDPGQPLRLGIAAVLVLKGGEQMFWAIAHCGPEPDFHHADSFVIEL
jgi:hypothetical protein